MWPGNVRELQNEIERAVAVAHDGETIMPAHLSPSLRSAVSPFSMNAPAPESVNKEPGHSTALPLHDARTDFEAHYISQVLAEHDGSISRAARTPGISRVALHQKIKDYGLR